MSAQRFENLADGVHRMPLDDGTPALVKVRHAVATGFFGADARGLEALRATRTLRVPRVIDVGNAAIVLEDLGSGRAAPADWRDAGAALARLHRRVHPRFGFDHDGWCGDREQDNTPTSDGHRFFIERRLRPQAARACASALLTADDVDAIERIGARLYEWMPRAPAVLVHGDLWLGNLHACADGALALIDAGAVHHGWAEADLAMLTLFGEPPRAFFEAYESEAGIDGTWRERAALCNLYHLLNHLNLFGAGYLGAVRAVLRRYA